MKRRKNEGAVHSAFVKANTIRELLTIEARPGLIAGVHEGQLTKASGVAGSKVETGTISCGLPATTRSSD